MKRFLVPLCVGLWSCASPRPAPPEPLDAREWVALLGSSRLEEASTRLRAMGVAALPELEKAASTSEPELSGRARRLIGLIQVAASLPPGFRTRFPGIEERLHDPGGWTRVFLGLLNADDLPADPRKVDVSDLDVLAERALRGASTAPDVARVLRAIARNELLSAAGEVVARTRPPEGPHAEPALETLGSLGSAGREIPRSVDALGAAFASALTRSPAEGRLERLARILKHVDAVVRQVGAIAAGRLRDGHAADRLSPLFQDLNAGVRQAAARAWGTLLPVPPPSPLYPLLSDSVPEVRAAGVRALGVLRDRTSADRLRQALKDADPQVREAAVQALQRISCSEATPDFVALLADDAPGVRTAAGQALELLGTPAAEASLVEMLRHPKPFPRALAALSLAALGAAERSTDILPLLKDEAEVVRAAGARALGELGAAKHKEDVGLVLKDSSPSVRRAAARALADLGGSDLAAPLASLLKDQDLHVRWSAAFALGRLDARDAASALVPLLEDVELHVRATAAEALGWLGARDVVPRLRKMLTEDESSVPRRSAAIALTLLGDPSGVARVLDDELDINYLNALRSPDAWRKLRTMAAPSSRRTSREDLLAEAAKDCGWAVVWESGLSDPAERVSRRFVNPAGSKKEIHALLEAADESLAFILEPGQIRILDSRQGLTFWKAWHARPR